MNENIESVETANSSDEVGSWIFSLAPVGVAFLFYVVFILQANLENTHLFLAYGATAGFIGLETFWILKGWQNGRKNNCHYGNSRYCYNTWCAQHLFILRRITQLLSKI